MKAVLECFFLLNHILDAVLKWFRGEHAEIYVWGQLVNGHPASNAADISSNSGTVSKSSVG